MCKKIITEGSARNIDPCLEKELEQIKTPYFQKKFEIKMSCCGHGKYSKTLIVQNRGSKCIFEWFSVIRLSGTKRGDSRAPFYKRDPEGYYYIPEVDEEKPISIIQTGC
jgi:hypothetical protein